MPSRIIRTECGGRENCASLLDDLGYARKDQAETAVLFERLAIRYERRADIFEGFHHLAATLICFRFVQRWSC